MKQTEFERLNIDYAEIQDQATAEDLIPKLIAVGANHAWVHVNPLLGPINFQRQWLEKLNWVTISGDAGQNANPCNVEWIRSIIRQCAEAKVACYVKQVGSKLYEEEFVHSEECWDEDCALSGGPEDCDGTLVRKYYTFTHPSGGDPAEWPEDCRVRQIPEVQP